MAIAGSAQSEFEKIVRDIAIESGFCANDLAFDTIMKLGLDVVVRDLIVNLWIRNYPNDSRMDEIRKRYKFFKAKGFWNF